MLAVLDCKTPIEAEKALIGYGFRTLRLPPHPLLPPPIASHPDMLLFFASHAILCTESYASIAKSELLEISSCLKMPIVTIPEDYEPHYPKDVLLNAVSLGDHLLCHPTAVTSNLKEQFKNAVIPVKQGYTKCSTLPIGNNALITSDSSVFAAAARAGLDALQISSGHIQLNGYDYGFIGGSSSFAPYKETDTVYFCGDISSHPDAVSIVDFCSRHGYRVQSLGNFYLTDIGTIFLI